MVILTMTLYFDSVAILTLVTPQDDKITWNVNEFLTSGTGVGNSKGSGEGPNIPKRRFKLEIPEDEKTAQLTLFVGHQVVFEGEYKGGYSPAGTFEGTWG